jgi:hypothetical protein
MMVIIFSAFVCIAQENNELNPPIIVGTTEASIYADYTHLLWFPEDSTAKLSIDGGAFTDVSFGNYLTSKGKYQLIVSLIDNPELEKTINFEILSDYMSESLFYTNQSVQGTRIEIEYEGGEWSHYYEDGTGAEGNPAMAIWAEKLSGEFLNNIYISTYAATNYPKGKTNKVIRKAMLPYWFHKAGSENPAGTFLSCPECNPPKPSDIDAVSGATNKYNYKVISNLPLNPDDDNKVRILFEIQQAWDKYGWYFNYENKPDEIDPTIGEPSLIYAAEVDLGQVGVYNIGGTALDIEPIGYSHPQGLDGYLYTEFYKYDETDGQTKYIFEEAHKMLKSLRMTVIKPVISLLSFDGQSRVTIVSGAGTTITDCKAVGNPSPSDAPGDVDFPLGFFEFTISGVAPNAATSVIIYFTGTTFDTYYKHGPTPSNQNKHWYQFMDDGFTGAELASDRITLKFVNGDRGDDDLDSTNSVIIDVGGPGNINSQSLQNASGGGGGGCFITMVSQD